MFDGNTDDCNVASKLYIKLCHFVNSPLHFTISSFGSFTAGLCPTVLESAQEDDSSSLTSP